MTRLWAAVLLALLSISPAAAQDTTSMVQFERGKSSATLNGVIRGNDIADFVLGARAGQTMSVILETAATNGDGVIYFNILPPGSTGEAIYNGSMEGNQARITLPSDGDYTVRVYLMGNDRDTDKTVGFDLTVGIL